ncbi:LysR family transcriptional regulator [Xanthobacter sp. ZOL 2024]
MDGLTLDQIQVFLAVVDTGSFSAAARALNRAQSAVTYAVRRLEDQTGAALFDRAEYRPALTEAGRALLPRARRIAEAVGAFRMEARGIAGGLEAELTLVVDAMFPMTVLLEALKGFRAHFPTVQTRLYVEILSASAQLVMDGVCNLGIVVAAPRDVESLARMPLLDVELALVAAPSHPLAQRLGAIPAEVLRDHVQLVLTERSGPGGARDQGVHATQTWRIADLGAKHAMLRAGLGYGSMPLHLVAADLADGTLVRLTPQDWDGRATAVSLPMCVVRRVRDALGPATQWMGEHLVSVSRAVGAG